MKDAEIINRLQTLASSVLGRDDIVLDKKTKFDDISVNSFALVQLICAIEDEFEIEIPNAAIKTVNSGPAAVRIIKKCLKNKTNE